MREREVFFKSGNYMLSGTITLPIFGANSAGVLLIPGSGQVDRDENAKKIQTNIFREMAHFLVNNDIASLRYDKRGIGSSGGNFWETGLMDNVSDALSALEYFKEYNGIKPDKVFLLGYSEGAIIATKIATKGADTAGVILVAGSAQSGEDVLKWQTQQVLKTLEGFNAWLIRLFRINVAKTQQKQIEKIKRSSKDWYRVQLVTKINAKWMREFMAYNPTDDLPHIKNPILAITGSKDIQVNPGDLNKMAKIIKTDFEYHIIPDVTHILRADLGQPSLSTYGQQAARPMDPRVLSIILEWLNKKI